MNALPNRSSVTNLSYQCVPVTIIIVKLKVFKKLTANRLSRQTSLHEELFEKERPVSIQPRNIQFLVIQIQRVSNVLSLELMKEIPIQDNKNVPPITKGILKQVSEKITESFSFLRSKI